MSEILVKAYQTRVLDSYLFCSLQALITPLIQLPVFISFFLAIRRMANAPVESMKDGGALWFPDLVSYDPTFALPVIASLSMLLAIEVRTQDYT